MKKISALSLTLLASSILIASGCGDDGKKVEAKNTNEPIVLKVGHDAPETVPVAKGLAYWSKLVAERTNNQVQIKIYNNATLGSANDYAVNCQLGTLDVGAVNQSVMTSFVPSISAIDIPYLITSYEHADRLFANDGPLTQYYTKEISNAGINLVNLDIWEVGFREFSNSKRAINHVDDIEGIRLRVLDSKVHQGFWKSLNTDPVPMSWGEAYTALQQKAIDGVENAISILDSNNINEVNKYLAMTDHNYSSIFIIMSEKSFKELSKEQQDILISSAKEAGKYQREEQRKQADDAVKNLANKGMTITYPSKEEIINKASSFLNSEKEKYPEVLKIVESN